MYRHTSQIPTFLKNVNIFCCRFCIRSSYKVVPTTPKKFLIRLKISYIIFLQYQISPAYRKILGNPFFFTTIDPPQEFQNSTAFPHLAQSNLFPFSTVDPYDKHTPDVYFPFFVLMEFIGWYFPLSTEYLQPVLHYYLFT